MNMHPPLHLKVRKAGHAVLAILFLILGFALRPAQAVDAAGPFTVNTTSDTYDALINGTCADASSKCSLRAAVEEANASATATVINILPGTYNLTLGELSVAPNGGKTITLQASGGNPTNTIIHQSTAGRRVLNIDAGSKGSTNVTITGVAISGGHDAFDLLGGAGILAGSVTATPKDTLTLSSCVITDNHVSPPNASYTGQPGGGIQMAGGNLSITSCTFTNNTSGASQGGAIAFVQPNAVGPVSVLSIMGSNFTNNGMTNTSGSGPDGGGAIWINTLPTNSGANAHTITTSTFTANSVAGTSGNTFGGGININTGTLNIDHSTFVANSATGQGGQGGAVYVDSGTANIQYTRFTGNSATNGGSGIYNHTSNAAVTNGTNNWWGCNAGPGGTGCDTAAQNSGNALTTSPYIVLSHTANPAAIAIGQATTLTASFLQNSTGTALAPADISVLVNLPITWQNPVLGALSNTQIKIQSNGTATATFTAASAGTGHADGKVDNGIATANIDITPPDLAITKSHGDTFHPGDSGKIYTLTVTNNGPGSTTGTITVVDALPAGLTATTIAGTGWNCTLGTLTCTRNDALSAGSSYPSISVTVNVDGNAPASVTNQASVSGSGDNTPGNDTASDPTLIHGLLYLPIIVRP